MAKELETTWFRSRIPTPDTLAALEAEGIATLADIAIERAIADPTVTPLPREGVDRATIEAAMATAIEAAKKVSKDGDKAALTDEEKAALQLFVLVVSRPALFVRSDRVVGNSPLWPDIDVNREMFPRITRGVGRIERSAGVRVGTGFVIGDRRVLTNNHVVAGLLGHDEGFWRNSPAEYANLCASTEARWRNSAPLIDFCGEADSAATNTASIVRVVAHHSDIDVAVLELETVPPTVTPLKLATTQPAPLDGLKLFAVGYPVGDTSGYTPSLILRRIFGSDAGRMGTKRVSPGYVLRREDAQTFAHDASTLPGSSGSCLVDFDSCSVIGIHFSGGFKIRANFAVPLWPYAKDRVLLDAGVQFS